MHLLFSFDHYMRVEETHTNCRLSTLITQTTTVACQLSSTLMQVLFSFDQKMSWENSHTNSRLSTLTSLVQPLLSFEQDIKVEKTLMQNYVNILARPQREFWGFHAKTYGGIGCLVFDSKFRVGRKGILVSRGHDHAGGGIHKLWVKTTPQAWCNLSFANETTFKKPEDNKFWQSTCNKSVDNLQQTCTLSQAMQTHPSYWLVDNKSVARC